MDVSVEAVAQEVLEVVPVVMRTIRAEMRSQRGADLNVPLFRTLLFLERHPGVSLQHLAEHLGLTPPTVSKIVDGLVLHSVVSRQSSQTDRRKITLQLTPGGQEVLDKSRSSAQASLVELLTPLSAEQCAMVYEALQIIQPLFQPNGDKSMQGEQKI
jgi:DNA-binding MarR family transcriptional regulator